MAHLTKLEKLKIMREYFPNAHAELNYETPWQLLIAVALSAQTTDKAVNKVTKDLFYHYPDANSLKSANYNDVLNIVKKIGLANTKTKNIIALSKTYDEDFNNIMPKDRNLLTSLPGVGVKTANVCLANIYDMPYMAVDTHIERITKRTAIAPLKASVLDIEKILERVLKGENINDYHHTLIFFGRYHCTARNPKCNDCRLKKNCRYYKSEKRKSNN